MILCSVRHVCPCSRCRERWRGAVAAVAAMVALMVAVAVVLRFDNGAPRNT